MKPTAVSHSPGPWTCESSLGIIRSSNLISVVAVVPGALKKNAIKCPAIDLPITADMRLIAAAPELLSFAQWVMGQLQGDSGTGESYWEQFPEYLAGKDAIAKATGGRP